jgi:hypothetical protein
VSAAPVDGPRPNEIGEWLQNKLLFPFLGKREPQPKRLPPPDPKPVEAAPAPTAPKPAPPGGLSVYWAEGHPPLIAVNGDPAFAGQDVTLALRPEKMAISKTKPDAHNALQGSVIDIAYLGNVSTYHVELDNGLKVRAQMANTRRIARRDITWEDNVWVSFSETSGVVLRD